MPLPAERSLQKRKRDCVTSETTTKKTKTLMLMETIRLGESRTLLLWYHEGFQKRKRNDIFYLPRRQKKIRRKQNTLEHLVWIEFLKGCHLCQLMRTKKTETAVHNTMLRRYGCEHACRESTDPGVDGSVFPPFMCFQFFFCLSFPFFRSRWVGPCNSHTKQMSRSFYRPIYF